MDFEKLKIKDYKYWELYLNVPHYYLGSVYLWAKRNDEIDFLEITDEEQKEFFQIAKEIKKILLELFKPDKFNIVNLQNKINHLHVHIIPRYASPRTLDNFEFIDENYGKMFYPYDEKINIPNEILVNIINKIENKLK